MISCTMVDAVEIFQNARGEDCLPSRHELGADSQSGVHAAQPSGTCRYAEERESTCHACSDSPLTSPKHLAIMPALKHVHQLLRSL